MSDQELDELAEGQRVISIGEDGRPDHHAGTVVGRDGEHYLIDVDRAGPWEHKARREQLRAVGCEQCDQTGFLAERREGITYKVPCGECSEKTGYYWWKVEEYKLRKVV